MDNNKGIYFGHEDKTLRFQVPQQVVTNAGNVMRARGIPVQSIPNLTKLYCLIRAVNGFRFTNFPYQEMADMIFSGHMERLTKAISTLKNAGLITVEKPTNKNTGHRFNSYIAIEIPVKEELVSYEFHLPDISFARMKEFFPAPQTSFLPVSGSVPRGQNASPTSQENDPINSYAKIYDKSYVYVPIEFDKVGPPTLYIQFKKKEYESGEEWVQKMIYNYKEEPDPMGKANVEGVASPNEMKFLSTFKSWYDELVIDGQHVARKAGITRDGRLYHMFHKLSKEQRKTQVLWDNKNVEEVWDAHSAFFAFIGYHIKQVYNGNDKEVVMKEANAFIDLTLENKLYADIITYHKKNGICIDREKAKVLCNRYRGVSRNRLLKKNGTRTSYKDVQDLHIVDSYFQEKFPHIRDFFLDYHRRKKLVRKDDNTNVYSVKVEGPRRIDFIQPKSVSNLQRDITPYELKLISLGICRELYIQYGIKSITVHDAIYTKKMTDEDKEDLREKIEQIYRTLLGRVMPVKTVKATGRRKVAIKEKATSVPLWGPEDEVVLHYEFPA
jgi:hypothetical protein